MRRSEPALELCAGGPAAAACICEKDAEAALCAGQYCACPAICPLAPNCMPPKPAAATELPSDGTLLAPPGPPNNEFCPRKPRPPPINVLNAFDGKLGDWWCCGCAAMRFGVAEPMCTEMPFMMWSSPSSCSATCASANVTNANDRNGFGMNTSITLPKLCSLEINLDKPFRSSKRAA